MARRKTACIAGDIHAPFICKRAVAAFIARVRYRKPNYVLQCGDAFDMFSFGRFPRTHCLMTPKEELHRGRKLLEEFWEMVGHAAPRADRIQLLGNHDDRPAKKMLSTLPEFEPFLDTIASWWKFPGVLTQDSSREEMIIDDVMYLHGYRKHGDHVRNNLMNTVVGHSHLGGVVMFRHGKRSLFELNCGYMGDPRSVALGYRPQVRVDRWTHGLGEVDGDGARFIAI